MRKEILSYINTGNLNSSITVILIHGALMTKEGMLPIASLLEKYNCILLDLTEHGESCGLEPKDIVGFAQDVETTIYELKEQGIITKKQIFLGYSMGGAVVCEIANRKNISVDGMILLSTGANLSKYTPLIDEIKAHSVSEFSSVELFKHAFGKDSSEEQRTQILDALCNTKVSDQLGYQDLLLVSKYNKLHELKNMNIPALIVHGNEDEVIKVEAAIDLYEQLDNSELVILPYRGHTLIYEETDIIRDKLCSFIKKIEV